MSKYEWKHPELETGEMLLGNFTEKEYIRIRWRTKRMGNIAYDIYGKAIESNYNHFPVFVQKQEFDEGTQKRKERR